MAKNAIDGHDGECRDLFGIGYTLLTTVRQFLLVNGFLFLFDSLDIIYITMESLIARRNLGIYFGT